MRLVCWRRQVIAGKGAMACRRRTSLAGARCFGDPVAAGDVMTDTFKPISMVLTLVAVTKGFARSCGKTSRAGRDATSLCPIRSSPLHRPSSELAATEPSSTFPDLIGTDFQKAWPALADVPYGETRSWRTG